MRATNAAERLWVGQNSARGEGAGTVRARGAGAGSLAASPGPWFVLVLITLVLAVSCGNTSTSTGTHAHATSVGNAPSSSYADPVTPPPAQLVSEYSDALNAMVSKATTAINDGNAAITAGDDKALAAALQREKAAREEFLARASVLTFPVRIQTQVNEMLTALRALISDIEILIYSVWDNQLYNRYVDQKDQDKADMYEAVKLIDAALGVPDTPRSPAPTTTAPKP